MAMIAGTSPQSPRSKPRRPQRRLTWKFSMHTTQGLNGQNRRPDRTRPLFPPPALSISIPQHSRTIRRLGDDRLPPRHSPSPAASSAVSSAPPPRSPTSSPPSTPRLLPKIPTTPAAILLEKSISSAATSRREDAAWLLFGSVSPDVPFPTTFGRAPRQQSLHPHGPVLGLPRTPKPLLRRIRRPRRRRLEPLHQAASRYGQRPPNEKLPPGSLSFWLALPLSASPARSNSTTGRQLLSRSPPHRHEHPRHCTDEASGFIVQLHVPLQPAGWQGVRPLLR